MSYAKFNHKNTSTEVDSDIFAVGYSCDDSLIGCALSNGQIALYSGTTGRLSYTLDHNSNRMPVTSLRFHPTQARSFISSSADGTVNCWNTRKPEIVWTIREEENQIFAIDLNKSGDTFATAGLDTKVRLYDYTKQTAILTFDISEINDQESFPGHTNRIFSVIFDPTNSSIIYSGGWDDTIQVWDTRAGHSVNSIFGPHICSDSICVYDKKLVAGSWRTNDQLQMFDLRTLRAEKTFRWKSPKHCLVYTTRFSTNGEIVFAAGSGSNELAAFSVKTGAQVGESVILNNSIFAIAISSSGKEITAGEGKGGIHTYLLQ